MKYYKTYYVIVKYEFTWYIDLYNTQKPRLCQSELQLIVL
jgi:hypothetical protein